MKKRNKLLILLLILISVLTLTACMREKVEKRVLVEAVKKRADDSLWGKTTYDYDKYGRKIKMLTTQDGKTIIKHTWKYDKQGNVVDEYVLDLRMGGRIEKRDIRKFDERGRVIEHQIIDKSKYLPNDGHYKYKYNNQDKVIEEVSLNKSGDIIWRRIYDYDDEGRKILYKSINKNGEEFKVEKWKYNDEGKETYYVKIIKGEEKEKKFKEFDDNGNKVVAKSYKDRKLVYNAKYFYDEEGNYIGGKSKDINGKIIASWKIDYNDKNEKILDEEYNSDGDKIKIQQWEYNQNGNRIRYWGSENGKPDFDWIYKYDGNGNLIYHAKRNGKGEVEDWESYEWYDNGQKKMSNIALISGRAVETYNKKGKLTEKRYIWKDKDEPTYWEKYYYNKQGEKEKKVWGREQDTSGYINYKYKNIKIYK